MCQDENEDENQSMNDEPVKTTHEPMSHQMWDVNYLDALRPWLHLQATPLFFKTFLASFYWGQYLGTKLFVQSAQIRHFVILLFPTPEYENINLTNVSKFLVVIKLSLALSASDYLVYSKTLVQTKVTLLEISEKYQ